MAHTVSALIGKASVRDFQHSLGPGHTSTMSCSLSLSIARPKDLAADRKLDLNGSLSGSVDCFCFLPGFGPSAHSADGNSSTSSSSFCRSSGVFSALFLLKVRFVASFRACKTQLNVFRVFVEVGIGFKIERDTLRTCVKKTILVVFKYLK